MKKRLVYVFMAAAVIAANARSDRQQQPDSVQLRAGIEVNNVSASVCLDLSQVQVCAFRLSHAPSLTVSVSTDTVYRAWQDNQPLDSLTEPKNECVSADQPIIRVIAQ